MQRISEETCDKAKKEFEEFPTKKAAMGFDSEMVENKFRDTTITFVPDTHWYTKIMYDFGLLGNKTCEWGFDITVNENIQFAEYAPGQHYDWHMDTFFLTPMEKSLTDRKVTVVCLMNDTSEFEEGALQIRMEGSEYTVPLEKGSMVAFPSFLYHRVIPVKSGLRKSATMWLSGPRFK
jgi:PKHD-type hydroxylase